MLENPEHMFMMIRNDKKVLAYFKRMVTYGRFNTELRGTRYEEWQKNVSILQENVCFDKE